ncbi:hypothetical protein [Thermocatellispora tengchongensis]
MLPHEAGPGVRARVERGAEEMKQAIEARAHERATFHTIAGESHSRK